MDNDRHGIVPGRPVTHPGIVAGSRTTVRVGRTQPFSTADLLPAHVASETEWPLIDAVVAAVEATGADSGVVEFSGALLPRISYCFPAYGDDVRPMLYSDTHESSGVVTAGTATVGYRRTAPEAPLTRWVHFHAAWQAADGELLGGHLWPETTTAGPLTNAVVWPLYGMSLVNSTCEETLLPVFAPEPPLTAAGRGTSGGGAIAETEGALRGDRTAVFARVRPNVDLGEVIASLSAEHGLAGGSVRGGTGSFVGALYEGGRVVDGPATEVITLSGILGEGAPALTCSLIDRHGAVHSGSLAVGRNVVGATYDLMLAGPRG
ncbi:DUF296 domain-containing protein [Brevibacterium album]|uniref:DUF296 domain-containing protein n=1 Tax=Brevibacterium album TaxID=417948 RepID=UPI000490E468|nr:DUF296 domain-containing protein [Brevibacterium album]